MMHIDHLHLSFKAPIDGLARCDNHIAAAAAKSTDDLVAELDAGNHHLKSLLGRADRTNFSLAVQGLTES